MAYRNYLRTAALLAILLITEAMANRHIKAAKHNLKPKVQKVLKHLQTESTCKHKEPTAVHTIGCLTELKEDFSDCQLVTIFDSYLTEASDLRIQKRVTEQLQAINQHIQDFQKELCNSKLEVSDCDTAFTESDGDYEKVCKVISLLELLHQWLDK